MKQLVILTAFFISLPLFSIQAKAEGLKIVSGRIVEVSPPEPPGLIHFTLLDSQTEQYHFFSIWSGQFSIQNYQDLKDQAVEVQYVESKAPIALGINSAHDDLSEIGYFLEPDMAQNGPEEYQFIGLYRGFTMTNNKLVFTIEGANGRTEEFAVPEGINMAPFEYEDYDGQELIVTYFLEDEIQVINIQFGDSDDDKIGEFSFVGTVIEYSDSGLGPFYNLELKNQETDETFYSLVMLDLMPQIDGSVVGKKLKVTYGFKKDNYFHSIALKSKYDPHQNDPNPDILTVEGDFVDCQIGDVNGYLYISAGNDGKTKEFLTEFECPEGINEGDRVVVRYSVGTEIEINHVELIK